MRKFLQILNISLLLFCPLKYVSPILGVLGEVKESSTLIMAIFMPDLRNSYSDVRVLFPRALKPLQNQRLKLQ